jgi:hypothetical protein
MPMSARWALIGVLLLVAFDAHGDPPMPASVTADVKRSARFAAMTAEVEVHRGGRVHSGRVIWESDGRMHLEHLDSDTAEWCRRVMQRATRGGRCAQCGGWDDRAAREEAKTCPTWAKVGEVRVLGEVTVVDEAGAHRVRLLRHRLLGKQSP